jgi:hypothetical protein
MTYVHNDGGRSDAGYKGKTSDCVCRAIAIAMGRTYDEIYAELTAASKAFAAGHRSRVARSIEKRGGTPRQGVFKEIYRPYLESLGWRWHPTMAVGSGCTVHLRASELPAGRLIVCVSRHVVAVIDGVIHDNHDPSRGGTRCVYGYFTAP